MNNTAFLIAADLATSDCERQPGIISVSNLLKSYGPHSLAFCGLFDFGSTDLIPLLVIALLCFAEALEVGSLDPIAVQITKLGDLSYSTLCVMPILIRHVMH
jgi:hypothetical protein